MECSRNLDKLSIIFKHKASKLKRSWYLSNRSAYKTEQSNKKISAAKLPPMKLWPSGWDHTTCPIYTWHVSSHACCFLICSTDSTLFVCYVFLQLTYVLSFSSVQPCYSYLVAFFSLRLYVIWWHGVNKSFFWSLKMSLKLPPPALWPRFPTETRHILQIFHFKSLPGVGRLLMWRNMYRKC